MEEPDLQKNVSLNPINKVTVKLVVNFHIAVQLQLIELPFWF